MRVEPKESTVIYGIFVKYLQLYVFIDAFVDLFLQDGDLTRL